MRYLLYIFLIIFIIACKHEKKQALSYLEKARYYYENAEYSSAQLALDSIKILFPKELEVRKESLPLARQIEIKEQERNISYCDSLLPVKIKEAESLKSGFLFEKDPRYDEIGKYIDKQQKPENKLQRSYIRCSVNESGEISLASVYYGSQPIRHTQLKVSKSNGEFTETQSIPYDGGMNYSFIDLGMTTEVVTYNKGKDNHVISFICNNKEVPLKAEYVGVRRFSFQISQADKNTIAKTMGLSMVLMDIEQLKKEKEKSYKRMEYLKKGGF